MEPHTDEVDVGNEGKVGTGLREGSPGFLVALGFWNERKLMNSNPHVITGSPMTYG